MSIDDLTTFITLYKLKNFTDAAFELNISQSTLSKKIKNMADDLSVRLVTTRNKRHIRITEDGELFYQFATKTIQNFDYLKSQIDKIHQLERGNLNISYTIDALNPLVISKLNQIMAELPQINFQFRLVNYQQLNQLMFKDDVDIVLANDINAFQTEFDFHELCKNELGLFSYYHVNLSNKHIVMTSLADKYVSNFSDYHQQIFPSFELLSSYLQINNHAVAILPVSIVKDKIPLIKKIYQNMATTFLVTPKNRDKRPIIKYIVQKFINDNLK